MNTEALITAAHTIHKAGGPKAPWIGDDAWCDLKHGEIYGEAEVYPESSNRMCKEDDVAVRCPPAVEAAVVAFAYELIDYLHSKHYAHSYLQPTRWSMHAVGADDKLVCKVSGESESKLAAAEALIVAVAGEVGGE